jgi:peptidoglycan/LPS O-acetylase OafA/YrhL
MLPFLGDDASGWASYYSKRLIRIYLPVWASLMFALLLASIVPRVASPSLSSWANLHDQVPDLLGDMLLLGGASSLNSPLWSLQWEMLYSLLLPLYLIIAIRVRRCWLLSIAGLLVVIALGNILYMSLPVFMPMFGIGALMAVGRQDLEGWGRHLGGCGWAFMLLAAVPLLCARWLYPQLPVVIALATVGGALVLFAFIAWRPAIGLGNNKILQWLGLRSFSLYLVHEPIILFVTYAFRSSDPVFVGLLALPLSLVTAEIFFRLVERPSQSLAGVVGRALGKRPSRRERVAYQDHRGDMF